MTKTATGDKVHVGEVEVTTTDNIHLRYPEKFRVCWLDKGRVCNQECAAYVEHVHGTEDHCRLLEAAAVLKRIERELLAAARSR